MPYIIFVMSLFCSFMTLSAKEFNQLIDITSESLEIEQSTGAVTFIGKVLAKQDDINIRADKMVLYRDQDSISKIVVLGNVKLNYLNNSAQGDHGSYSVKNKLLELKGKVSLQKGKNSIAGDSLVYDLKKGYSKISNNNSAPVRAVIVPNK